MMFTPQFYIIYTHIEKEERDDLVISLVKYLWDYRFVDDPRGDQYTR